MRLRILIACALLLSACTESGGTKPPVAISYLFYSGMVSNNTESFEVLVREWDGPPIGESNSTYLYYSYLVSLETPGDYVNTTIIPTEIEFKNIKYLEYSDLAIINTGQLNKQYTITNMILANTSGNSAYANVSVLTTIARGLASYKINMTGENISVAINTANNILSTILDLDILQTNFLDPTDESVTYTAISDGLKYSIYQAGISQMLFDWSIKSGNNDRQVPYTSAVFTDMAMRDVMADGILDGLGENGSQLILENYAIDANTYRHGIAVGILRFADNINNKTGFNKIDYLSTAIFINDNEHELFGGMATIPIDEGGPTILNFLPSDGSTIVGDNKMSAEIEDITGIPVGDIGIVEFLIDNIHYSYSGGHTPSSNFTVDVFQDAGTVGVHTITIKVTNNYGTTTTQTNTVTFDNR